MRWLKEIKDVISKGMTWLKANMLIKQSGLKTRKVPLMIIILPNEVDGDGRVDGGDDSGGRDEGRRYSHLFSFL